jgi:hypothetical protein
MWCVVTVAAADTIVVIEARTKIWRASRFGWV